jgi:hypothetical protein
MSVLGPAALSTLAGRATEADAQAITMTARFRKQPCRRYRFENAKHVT